MKLFCEDCGELDYILLDGYTIGDRVLEGVMFVFILKKGNVVLADKCVFYDNKFTTWKQDSYLRTLNDKYWLKQIKSVSSPDPEIDLFQCPICNDSDIITIKEK